jgi:hypothetical protein
VQWHPERDEAHGTGERDQEDPDSLIFAALVEAARSERAAYAVRGGK